jgi:hypothetical protein
VTPGGALGSREAKGVVGRRRARARDGPHQRRRQWRGAARRWLGMAREGGERRGLNRPARLWVTTDDGGEASSCYGGSTAERMAGAANGMGSAARTARYGGVAGAARGT